jgi:hypothetical protein
MCGFLSLDRNSGGGKCPEEEHTTCSGGRTILVTSAVYGEREYLQNKIFCKYYKVENVRNNKMIKCEKTLFYP